MVLFSCLVEELYLLPGSSHCLCFSAVVVTIQAMKTQMFSQMPLDFYMVPCYLPELYPAKCEGTVCTYPLINKMPASLQAVCYLPLLTC